MLNQGFHVWIDSVLPVSNTEWAKLVKPLPKSFVLEWIGLVQLDHEPTAK